MAIFSYFEKSKLIADEGVAYNSDRCSIFFLRDITNHLFFHSLGIENSDHKEVRKTLSGNNLRFQKFFYQPQKYLVYS